MLNTCNVMNAYHVHLNHLLCEAYVKKIGGEENACAVITQLATFVNKDLHL
jgi:hypothetical protein